MNRRDALRSLLTLPAVGAVSVAQVRPEDTIVLTPVYIDVPVVDLDGITRKIMRQLPEAIRSNKASLRAAIEHVVKDHAKVLGA